MIDHEHPLSVALRAKLQQISRGAVYDRPWPTSKADLALVHRIDELHLEQPFIGARPLRCKLLRESIRVGWRHLGRLMQRIGIAALCPQPGTSERHPRHKIYPYLLRNVAIRRSNQVWALYTTYTCMARGFAYLTAVVDVASRRVLAQKLAITLVACHTCEVIKQAFVRFGVPEIVNTDQGSQFTAEDFTKAVFSRGCRLSMHGKGAWRDNVFVERVWRTIKCEQVHLRADDGVSAAKEGLHNTRRSMI